jgi:hypothetical protein
MTEFIVSEYDEDGMWNRLSDLQTERKLTMKGFEKCVGYSPVVKELMGMDDQIQPGRTISCQRRGGSGGSRVGSVGVREHVVKAY